MCLTFLISTKSVANCTHSTFFIHWSEMDASKSSLHHRRIQSFASCLNHLFSYFREMTSEDLKLRQKATKDLYGPDKILPKVICSCTAHYISCDCRTCTLRLARNARKSKISLICHFNSVFR